MYIFMGIVMLAVLSPALYAVINTFNGAAAASNDTMSPSIMNLLPTMLAVGCMALYLSAFGCICLYFAVEHEKKEKKVRK
jgi:uncharacterized membrane protein (DUF106 family)